MRKIPNYKTPKVDVDGKLYFYNGDTGQYETDGLKISRSRDFKHWQQFLETHKSFRYVCPAGSFTAVKELRRGSKKYPKKSVSVWYAHRRINNKLRRKYLGKNENLTSDKLYQVAFDLAQLPLIEE